MNVVYICMSVIYLSCLCVDCIKKEGKFCRNFQEKVHVEHVAFSVIQEKVLR
jgi:hypothetical protein